LISSLCRGTAILAATAALFLVAGGTASSESRIVIEGVPSGTHLRLEVEGSSLIVRGPMSDRPLGCRLLEGHRLAACSLDEVGSVEIDTGPADDKIEVLERLPVPLVAYLGDGSDKLIGNAERDNCYPQGSDRNRCIGGGGDDVCISGPVNTDCVGEAGDDYCRTAVGSDGCWGGDGQDVCFMGEGQDGCHGEAGDDQLYGGPAGDQLYGGDGDDYCNGGPGTGRSRECEAGPKR
jgi:RTX calcium-binding nonapeptide repeat (4 copies)